MHRCILCVTQNIWRSNIAVNALLCVERTQGGAQQKASFRYNARSGVWAIGEKSIDIRVALEVVSQHMECCIARNRQRVQFDHAAAAAWLISQRDMVQFEQEAHQPRVRRDQLLTEVTLCTGRKDLIMCYIIEDDPCTIWPGGGKPNRSAMSHRCQGPVERIRTPGIYQINSCIYDHDQARADAVGEADKLAIHCSISEVAFTAAGYVYVRIRARKIERRSVSCRHICVQVPNAAQ